MLRSVQTTLIIDARHNGPPGSGNGGWTAGVIAAALPAPDPGQVTEVTLRQPPPLDTTLTVREQPGGADVVDPEGKLIATAARRPDDIAAVPAASRYEALAAASRYPGHGAHHFPTCFVCGPKRADGLRIFPGRLADGRTAAPFVVPRPVSAVTVWAALDCPGGWTVIEAGQPWVLGRMAVAVDQLPEPEDECVVTGQAIRHEGRKALVRTTLYGPDEQLLARAEATWIALPPGIWTLPDATPTSSV